MYMYAYVYVHLFIYTYFICICSLILFIPECPTKCHRMFAFLTKCVLYHAISNISNYTSFRHIAVRHEDKGHLPRLPDMTSHRSPNPDICHLPTFSLQGRNGP